MKFKFHPAEDETVDSEYNLLNDDGTDTNISIQDCRSYAGGFSVNRYERQGSRTLSVTFVGEAKTLKKAKALALAIAS